MKLTVEILENKFIFDYEIGTSKNHSEMPLSVDALINLVALIQLCRQTVLFENREELDEFRAKAYLKKHPEILVNKKENI